MSQSYENNSIDWPRFYADQGLQKLRKSGAKTTALCPFHDNHNTPAFWFTNSNGMWKCEAGCGTGNPTQFLAKKLGITTGEADAMLCELAGVDKAPPPKRAATPKDATYDVAAYAAEKGLDAARLIEWGLSAQRNTVLVPYAPNVPNTATRKRHRPGSARRFAWVTEKGEDGQQHMVGEMGLYGTFMLDRWLTKPATPLATVVLVEGESDCHALWSMGIPALGAPGASTFKAEWLPETVTEVLVHDEGDHGAEVFIEKVAELCAASGRSIAVKRWSTPGDIKDPSEYHRQHGEAALKPLQEAMRAAVAVEVPAEGHEAAKTTILGEYGLHAPKGWRCDATGVKFYNEETERVTVATSTPVVITGRIIDSVGRSERLRLAFLRGKKWTEVIAERSDAFSSRNIVNLLAPFGCHITSETAKHVVAWLGALEAANIDTLPIVRSARQLGWSDKHFMPTNAGGLLLDMPAGSEEVVAAFHAKGDRAEWLEAIGEMREKNAIFRFMVAAGLASTLLKATGGRIFFVYNWSPSRGGKTAAIKAALSAWGDPAVLLTTFNATSVGLERRAQLFRDLPLGIDERQAAGGRQERLDEIVYSLSAGTGRVRGARDGGLQTQSHWRTVAIATGEEPLSGSTSKTGVSTRVLEVYGSPFDLEEDAARMHRLTADTYGHIGPEFVEHVVKVGDGDVAALQDLMLDKLESFAALYASSHLSGIATVLAADVLLSEHFYGVGVKEAIADAVNLGRTILASVEHSKSGDVDEAALLFIEDWLAGNESKFSNSTFSNTLYGKRHEDGSWLVYPTALREGLEGAGFSYRKTLRALKVRDAVRCGSGGDTTTSQRVYGTMKRVVWIDATRLGSDSDGAPALTAARSGAHDDRPF